MEPRTETDYVRLFHQLNNQLGIILANAELLEHRIIDPMQKSRAEQVVTSALEAIGTAREIRMKCQQDHRND